MVAPLIIALIGGVILLVAFTFLGISLTEWLAGNVIWIIAILFIWFVIKLLLGGKVLGLSLKSLIKK